MSSNSNSQPSSDLPPAVGTEAPGGIEACGDEDNQSDNGNTSSNSSSSNSSRHSSSSNHQRRSGGPEASLHHLMKSLHHQANQESGHNASESGSNGGNNSDNSALVSLGNTSFGFNFDSDERFSNNDSKQGSGSSGGDSNTDSDGNERDQKTKKIKKLSKGNSNNNKQSGGDESKPFATSCSTSIAAAQLPPSQNALNHQVSSLSGTSRTTNSSPGTEAVASSHHSSDLGKSEQVTSSSLSSLQQQEQQQEGLLGMESDSDAANNAANAMESIAQHQYPQAEPSDRKRKIHSASSTNTDEDGDSGGYNTDDDERKMMSNSNPKKTTKRSKPQRHSQQRSHSGSGKPPKVLPPPTTVSQLHASSSAAADGDGGGASVNGGSTGAGGGQKREERNQREKERSFRIAKQISELRDLLSTGGVVVSKGTKSSVLTEAANYIRMLQQHQYRSEIDRHQLVQQMQIIGSGAQGPQAAQAIRHFAAQNGVWSLGNFGGVPPKSAMTPFYNPAAPQQAKAKPDASTSASTNPLAQTKIEPSEYRFIFNSCGVGIAIASMGGAFIDCNHLFAQLSNYTKQELCSLTIFNLTARQDLQTAFDQISQLISPPLEEAPSYQDATSASTATPTPAAPKPIVLRGSMKNRDDLGMSISIVRGDDGIAKCFCVTLIKNPTSPFDIQRPIPVSYSAILAEKEDGNNDMKMAPAFTSG